MNKTQGRKLSKLSKKAANSAKKKRTKVKVKTRRLLSSAKKKLNNAKKKSFKTLHHAKNKVHATEEEILTYVKENPVKSVSAVALTGLIVGFISRFRKK